MIPRMQPPAYSPVSLGTVAAGVLGLAARAQDLLDAEAAVRAEYGAADTLLVDSGTSALGLAIKALGRPGAPVALPAYGCYDLATAADAADSPVVLYDVEPTTLSPRKDSLLRAFELGATTLVVAHLYGVPADLTLAQRLAKDARVALIEDAAQGVGAKWAGLPLGSFGQLAVLSFGRGKGVSAGGGGALLAHDEVGQRALEQARGGLEPPDRGFRSLAVLGSQWLFARPATYAVPASLPFLRLGETLYHTPHPARRLSGIGASVLSRSLQAARAEAVTRRANANALRMRLARVSGIELIRPSTHGEPGFLRLPVLAGGRESVLKTKGARQMGIMPGYPASLARLDGFHNRVVNLDADFSGAEELASTLYTIPTHSRLTDSDIERLAQLAGA